MKEQHYP